MDTTMTTTPVLQEVLLKPFATAIFAKSSTLRDWAEHLSDGERRRLLESISDDIKKCSNFITPRASRAAIDFTGGSINLFAQNWHTQGKFDPKRAKYHFEHFVPVSYIRDDCRKADSTDAVLDVLRTRIQVVWILKTEDAMLTGLGYQKKREDPGAAYKTAGIFIVESQP